MWLNCHTGLARGIAGITKKWLVTCMFLLSVPLCLAYPSLILLALGQRMMRHSYMFRSIASHVILDGLPSYCLSSLLSQLIVSYGTASPYCSTTSYCLAIPVGTDLLSLLFLSTLPTLNLGVV